MALTGLVSTTAFSRNNVKCVWAALKHTLYCWKQLCLGLRSVGEQFCFMNRWSHLSKSRVPKRKWLKLTVWGWWALWSFLVRCSDSSSLPHTSPWSRSCGPSPWETPAPPPPRQSTGCPCAPGSACPSPVGPWRRIEDEEITLEMRF